MSQAIMGALADPDGRPPAPLWGPRLLDGGRVRFRLWAPKAGRVLLRAGGRDRAMAALPEGWHQIETTDLRPDDSYAFVLPDGAAVPDPAARAQAGDVHGPSRLVDPSAFRWRCDWRGRDWSEAVIAEVHVGTFTPQGTFAAAAAQLPDLAATGITAIEIMPVGQFPGNRGWGYDGVLPFAPHPAYGSPDALRALVDSAHACGLMVLLDVVYNHFGPDGNHLHRYAPDFFDAGRHTPWGAAIAYERQPVRRYFIENALHWLIDYRMDGLRLDAVDQIRDTARPDVLTELAQTVRAAIPDRPVHLTTEDNRNVAHLHARGPDGSTPLYTAEWNDDFHNAAHVLATGETEGYYADFAADPTGLLARSLAEGFGFQGEVSGQTGAPRGEPSGHLPPLAFIDFLQNHDQTGNRALGERLAVLADPAMLTALTAIHLLSPHVPLLFMGEEYGETRPFRFFTDFSGDLARAVREGRRAEFAGFAAFADGGLDRVPDPNDPATFAASRLDRNRAASPDGQAHRARVRDLLALRRDNIVPRLRRAAGGGRVLSHQAGIVAVDWPLDGARLELRANLGSAARALPVPTGARIFATHPETAPAAAPPCSVFWHLRDDDRDAAGGGAA